jgi:hypothetical protein
MQLAFYFQFTCKQTVINVMVVETESTNYLSVDIYLDLVIISEHFKIDDIIIVRHVFNRNFTELDFISLWRLHPLCLHLNPRVETTYNVLKKPVIRN